MTDSKNKPARGRPSFEPTDRQRGMVQALSQAGYPETEIAEYLGLDPKTLRKHFARELRFAAIELIAGAVQNLGRMALGAKAQFDDAGNMIRAEVLPNLGAICFLLKTKGKHLGFTERTEVTGADGGPIDIADAKASLASKLAQLRSRKTE